MEEWSEKKECPFECNEGILEIFLKWKSVTALQISPSPTFGPNKAMFGPLNKLYYTSLRDLKVEVRILIWGSQPL